MKFSATISCARVRAGYLLLECLVYIAVFAVITGLGLMAFYQCWDNSKALRLTTDDVTAALRAGERWRADMRGATGKITVENTATGELLRILVEQTRSFTVSPPVKSAANRRHRVLMSQC